MGSMGLMIVLSSAEVYLTVVMLALVSILHLVVISLECWPVLVVTGGASAPSSPVVADAPSNSLVAGGASVPYTL
eukprot:654472-Ditylum_brightwellii.AAC.1